MKRFLLIAVLLCCPILVTTGCDMGTYNKRLTEPVNSSPAEETAPAVTDDADKQQDESADETSGRGER